MHNILVVHQLKESEEINQINTNLRNILWHEAVGQHTLKNEFGPFPYCGGPIPQTVNAPSPLGSPQG